MLRFVLFVVPSVVALGAQAHADDVVNRVSTAYAEGPPRPVSEDWVDCRPQERMGIDPESELGRLLADCRCTRDTVRLAAAIKGGGDPVDDRVYEPADVVEVAGPLYLGDPEDYPGGPEAVGECAFNLWGPRIRDSVAIRGVGIEASIVGSVVAIWTPSMFGLPQPEPARVVIEDLAFEEFGPIGPAVQTGVHLDHAFVDLVIRDVDVHVTGRRRVSGCPANAFQLVIHHRGSLLLDGVSGRTDLDPALVPVPGPATGCFIPAPARAIGVAVGLAEDLDMVVRDSSFELFDLEGASLEASVGLYLFANAQTSIDIEESSVVADRGVFDIFHDGTLGISESSIDSGAEAISVYFAGGLATRENHLALTGADVGIRIGAGVGPSVLRGDAVVGESSIGVEVSGVGHQVIETDLSGLAADSAVLLTEQSERCTVREVDGEVVDLGIDNEIVAP